MEKKRLHGSALYLSLLGAVAFLCLAAGVWWLLRGQAGKAGDGTGPLAQYDEIYTRLLPESDVLALQQGVPVYDETELQKRLEDYGL